MKNILIMRNNGVVLMAALFCLLAAVPARADITSDLVAYWTFDEGTGTTVADATGHGHDGAFGVGTPQWVVGQVGNYALSFFGADDVVVPADAAFDLQTALTVSAWVKTTATSVSYGDSTIFSRGQDAYFLALGDYGNDAPKVTGWLSISGWQKRRANTPVNDGDWHLATMTFNGSHLRIYRDGVLDAAVTAAPGSVVIDMDNMQQYIGSYGSGGGLNGSIDDLRVYSRALSDADVLELYQAASVGKAKMTGVGSITGVASVTF